MSDFNEKIENELLEFVQINYGLEVFTPGLERTKPLYEPFIKTFKDQHTKVTIIAGTNGKGQTAQTLNFYLESIGLRSALWTSPHILSLRERFHFNGQDISYSSLTKEIHEAHAFLKLNYSNLVVSFYEFLFLVFLRLAKNEGNSLNHLILEVGLGGKLDAVNHFDADCTCITSISRDHQMLLGNRFDLILKEKIAVARSGKPLFTQFKLQYLNELTNNYCKKYGIIWHDLGSIKGSYFEENERMAMALFQFLEQDALLETTLAVPLFKGRREEMTFNGNTLIFIGAHNIDGVRKMIELLSTETKNMLPTRVLISFSKRPVNEVEVMLKSMIEFFGNESKLILSNFDHPKALDINSICLINEKINKISKGLLDFVTDWKSELHNSKNQKILVCGSYYFVGEVQRFILSNT